MKKLLTIVALISALSTPAYSQTMDITLSSGSSTDTVGLSQMSNGLYGFDYTGTSQFVPIVLNGVTLDVTQLEVDQDPSVRFAFGINNPDGATGTTPFTMTFSTAVTLTPGQYAVSSSFAGSLTKGIDGDSAPVVLSPPSTGGDVVQAFVGATTDAGGRNDAGVDLVNSPISVSPTTGNSQPFGGFSSAPGATYQLNSTATEISVTTAFDLTSADSASFTGRFDIDAVPEPSSWALGVMCVGMFVFLTRRRSQT